MSRNITFALEHLRMAQELLQAEYNLTEASQLLADQKPRHFTMPAETGVYNSRAPEQMRSASCSDQIPAPVDIDADDEIPF